VEPRIVQVTPTEEYFSVTWQVGIRCNYDCMYCSPEWHDNSSKHHSLETLQEAWRQIYLKTQYLKLPYKVSFTGGELTTNRHFLPFVLWLRENYGDKLFKLLLTTNGSATFKYYNKMFDAIDNISFSVHSEHINEQKFFDMIVKLKQQISASKFIHVDIMNEAWNRDRIPLYIEFLANHGISYSMNEIDYKFQNRVYPIFQGKLNLEV
jgi:molybdenum cofactor biosynthesis enzyme MoaA